MLRDRRLLSALREVYEEQVGLLGPETIDEMGIRSYLGGNPLSRFVFWRKLAIIVAAARLAPSTRVLDFACGWGVLLPALCRDRRVVYATDLQLSPAKRLASILDIRNVQFLPPDCWHEEIDDGSLDIIVAANVLEHVDERQAILAQFARKLSTNGRFVISGPTENFLYRLGRRLIGFSGHYHVANVLDVMRDAASAGFRRIYQRRWPIPGPFCLYHISAFHIPQ